MNRSQSFLLLLVLTSIADLLALMFDWSIVHEGAKPLIMLSLIGYYLTSVTQRSSSFVRALFFCWAGDVLLLFKTEGELFFIAGLGAFLIGHVHYIVSYREHQWAETKNQLLTTQKIWFSLPIVVAGTGLIAMLFPTLGPLKIPVLVYAAVLMLMVMTALFRYGRTTTLSFWMMFGGAVIFMVSDSALAINKFYVAFNYSGPIIMLTYISAQYLIVEGALNHKLVKN